MGVSANESFWSGRHGRDAARAQLAQSAVAFAFGVRPEDIAARSRGCAAAARARQVAMYLTHVAFGLTMARTAAAFGRDRSTAAHACKLVEDERDDAAFDARLDALEAILRDAVALECLDAAA
ncbi:MAG: helix-turn-helix domain-containing protein [Maricaulaceae bacterium]